MKMPTIFDLRDWKDYLHQKGTKKNLLTESPVSHRFKLLKQSLTRFSCDDHFLRTNICSIAVELTEYSDKSEA